MYIIFRSRTANTLSHSCVNPARTSTITYRDVMEGSGDVITLYPPLGDAITVYPARQPPEK